ncbi:MAG: serine/threonine-protein kinase, partial [Gemmatimonadetes bacterium]|nr:serine/threonine-protein kinase [Gemmatimonadota bacterium]
MASTVQHPERLGPYYILRVLGEGGMGIVYEAEQREPVRRRVALKMMKPGVDTREVIARFEAERQALAVMEHPGIATVFDAGASDDGRPYFVMELVHGIPFDHYCDQEGLPPRRRIELFIKVCDAIQHAHHKGVIHRDLKPANILVSEVDGEPRPTIIDFGVAKATGRSLTDRTLVTSFGQAIGTLAYMSPEQAFADGLDVDTRTDIYALGVILFETLTGQIPLDPKALGSPAFLASLTERDRPLPTVVQALTQLDGNRLDYVLRARGTDLSALKREVSGDLGWIVLHATEKDRSRRYETANGLAMDLRRYLADEPVVARPPTPGYRLRKFVRRNFAATLAATVAIVGLVVGATAATLGMVRARAAERAALSEAATRAEVSSFLTGLFEVSNPLEGAGNTVTARELLDSAAVRIEAGLSAQPEVQASLMLTMGEAYTGLGLYPEAAGLLRQGLELRRTTLSESDPGVAEAQYLLARALSARGEYDEAVRLGRSAASIQEAALGSESPELAATLATLGSLLYEQGQFDEAETLFQRSLDIREAAVGRDEPAIAQSLGSLASVYMRTGRYDEADRTFVRVVEIREASLGSDHPDVALALSNLGAVRWQTGRTDDADSLFRRSLDIRRRTLGPEHPDVGDILNNLGVLAWTRGDYEAAAGLYEEALEIYRSSLGPDHLSVSGALNNIAETRWQLGQYEIAESLFLESLAIKERVMEPTHPSVAVTLNGLANVYRETRRYPEADALYARALEVREAAMGPDDASVQQTLRDWVRMLREAGRE